MATKNLSDYDLNSVPNAQNMKFGIVVAEWNYEVTGALAQGAFDTLVKHGAQTDNILIKHVPGTFELSLGGQLMAQRQDVDAIILLGCVIQGETRHFDFICQGVAQGATDLNLKFNKPVDSYYSMYYIALLEYKEILNEIFSQSHEGPFRSESGQNHQIITAENDVCLRTAGRFENCPADGIQAFENIRRSWSGRL